MPLGSSISLLNHSMQKSLAEQIPDAYARFKFRREALKEEHYGLKQLKRYGFARSGFNPQIEVPHPWSVNMHGSEIIAHNPFFATIGEPIHLEDSLQIANWKLDSIPIIRCIFKTGQKHKPKYNAVYVTGIIRRNIKTYGSLSPRCPNLPEHCLYVSSLAMPTCRMINHNILHHYHEMHTLVKTASIVIDCELGSVLSI